MFKLLTIGTLLYLLYRVIFPKTNLIDKKNPKQKEYIRDQAKKPKEEDYIDYEEID